MRLPSPPPSVLSYSAAVAARAVRPGHARCTYPRTAVLPIAASAVPPCVPTSSRCRRRDRCRPLLRHSACCFRRCCSPHLPRASPAPCSAAPCPAGRGYQLRPPWPSRPVAASPAVAAGQPARARVRRPDAHSPVRLPQPGPGTRDPRPRPAKAPGAYDKRGPALERFNKKKKKMKIEMN